MSMYNKIIDLQKLNQAWNHVKRNHPASGVDEVTYAEFDENRKTELYQLHLELQEHRYEPLPVKEIVLYKGEKARTVALFCMRDKVVQQSVAAELGKIYEPLFSDRAFAYRPDKSALNAVAEIEEAVKKYEYVLKLDIVKYFDRISQKKLLGMLSARIREQDVTGLVERMLRTKVLDTKSGELSSKMLGVFQGSGMAPILSNVYLMDFDCKMQELASFYVRYADDILFLGNSKDEMEALMKQAEGLLSELELSVQQEKMYLGKVGDGFTYLGYAFDTTGKRITDKAQETLQDRLEEMWLVSVNLSVEEKLKKAGEILGGWQQYYRAERVPGSMLEYAAALYMAGFRDSVAEEKLVQMRQKYENDFRDLLEWLVDFWKKRGDKERIRLEYEQFFCLDDLDVTVVISCERPEHAELLETFSKILIHPTQEDYDNLIQIYSDLGCYNRAGRLHKKMMEFQEQAKPLKNAAGAGAVSGDVQEWEPTADELQVYMSLFLGREDLYAVEETENGRRRTQTVYEALTEGVVKKHLQGHLAVQTYIQRPNATCSFLVLDIDICKKVLLQHPVGSAEFGQYLKKAADIALQIQHRMIGCGMRTMLEFSGCRGYHLWLFFNEWIPTRYANMLQDYIEQEIRKAEILKDNDIQIEFFPNKAHIRKDKPGQCIKLPCGVHSKSGKTSYFLTKELEPVTDVGKFLKNMAKYSLKAVKRILSAYSGDMDSKTAETKTVDTDIFAFGAPGDAVLAVLNNCNLMRYLCQKARTTGYLNHFERLSVLHVFGHLGEDGKAFVHTVMEFTLNYKYAVTEKFIQKLPAKPVSCVKLREQYKTLTAEYGCSCNFKRTNQCYPSPVLHALKNTDGDVSDITLPTSRTLSKTKEKELSENLNIPKKVQDLSARILELKKQKRGLDKSISKLEKMLENIFDNAGVDCMETEMGLLVRRKTDSGYEWLVEL